MPHPLTEQLLNLWREAGRTIYVKQFGSEVATELTRLQEENDALRKFINDQPEIG